MATTAVDPIFVDTNVLVYANVAAAPFHDTAFQALESLGQAGVPLWISRQILREYLATLSRPQSFALPQPPIVLETQVRIFEAKFTIAEDGPAVTTSLLQLINQTPVGGRQIHDANIVATMQVHSIRNLLTYNVADFRRFAAIITIVSP
jgi:predicted nucleic acid-binding protein